jgi:DNA-binding SARP family transcriptional activator/tetratricopeptide (TPR) repeat protein
MEFHILGRTLTVLTDSMTPVNISRAQVRATICAFVLHADAVLPATQIMNLVWDDLDTGPEALRACVYRVRQSLGRDRIETMDGAYRFRVAPGDVIDLHRFRDLHERGVAARDAGDDADAVRLLGEGLKLWDDPPLGDLPPTISMAGVIRGLVDERAAAHEALVDAHLALGRHQELLPDLRKWVTSDPLNERVRTHVMLALYRCGRKAEALGVYDDVRGLLDEVGVAPGSELQLMRDRILADDPTLTSPGRSAIQARPAPVRQLPPDVADFTGRAEELDALTRLLTPPAEATAVPIAEIIGPPGVGKTSLAVHVAHQVSHHYPDGQLHFQLTGASATPREPGTVLDDALRALGVPATDIPESIEQRTALYRSRLAGRRLLIVADDAAGPEQVRPLLPGTAGCAVIVTSRTQLTGLTGHLWTLGPLTDEEARRLLTGIIGEKRILAEPAPANDLVATCAGLPLALRIIGARLATRPSWPLVHLAGLLRHRRKRLDQLQAGDLAIRASIAASYDLLETDAARAFRLLSLIGPHDTAGWVLAMLLDRANADDVIETLLYRCLLTDVGIDSMGEPRYRMHDLIREFAAERLAEDPERDVALVRLGFGWLELVDIADEKTPHLPYAPASEHYRPKDMIFSVPYARRLAAADPQTWLRIECPSTLTVVRVTAENGNVTSAYGIALRLSAFLHLNGHHADAEELWRTVAAAAEREGFERIAAISKLRAAAVVGADRLNYDQAMALLDEVIPVLENLGDQHSLARALAMRADCAQLLSAQYLEKRDTLLELARRDAEKSLQLARDVANRHAEFSSLRVLGLTFSQFGRHDDAIRYCTHAVTVAHDLGRTYEGHAAWALAQAYMRAEAYGDALTWAEDGLVLARDIGHALGIANFQREKGFALQGLGRHDEAISELTQAIEEFQRQGFDAPAAACRLRISVSYRAIGRMAKARAQLQQSADEFALMGMSDEEAQARTTLRSWREGRS